MTRVPPRLQVKQPSWRDGAGAAGLLPSLASGQLGPAHLVRYLRTMKLSPGRRRRAQTRPQLPRLHRVSADFANPRFRLGLGLCHPRPPSASRLELDPLLGLALAHMRRGLEGSLATASSRSPDLS